MSAETETENPDPQAAARAEAIRAAVAERCPALKLDGKDDATIAAHFEALCAVPAPKPRLRFLRGGRP